MPDATAADLGEFGLIARVVGRLGAPPPSVLVGPGDDAALVAAADGRVVATTDVLVEGVHFRRDWSSAYDVGRKAAAASLADVAAMGGTATALLVGLSAPPDLPVEWALRLGDGLRDEGAVVGAAVVGGDTTSAPVVVVGVTALGDLGGRRPVLRSGAQVGDVVVLAGRTGASVAGLRLLGSGSTEGALVDAHRCPSPPYASGPALAALGATAMLDVSDGLVADLGHLCRASGVGVALDPASLPRDDGVTVEDALGGGEDHALVATVPLHLVEEAHDVGAVAVGRVVEGSHVVDLEGRPLTGGWEHWT